MNKLDYRQVFVPGGFPPHTYNSRENLKLEEKIESVLHNLCKLVVVTGHTKSGKTVLVQKILPRNKAVWIDGGGISTEDDFWNTVVEDLELSQTTESVYDKTSTSGVLNDVSAGGNIALVKAETKFSVKYDSSETFSNKQSRSVSSKILATKKLIETRTPVIIDDFHYLPKEIQASIVRTLKPLIFQGVPIVIIAIPHRRYDALKVEKEMTGRILSVSVPIWNESELEFIPNTGFSLLKYDFDKEFFSQLSKQSVGSPHLMQEFCRAICESEFLKLGKNINIDIEQIQTIFKEIANNTIGRPIFEKLAKGPRQRSDRLQRLLKTGEHVDIYGLVLGGLAHLKPGLVTLEYEDLRTAIKEICVPENVPNVQEIARVLKHMSEIAATDKSSTPVIDFDEEEKRLHITDPFFAFYLRWGDITSRSIINI